MRVVNKLFQLGMLGKAVNQAFNGWRRGAAPLTRQIYQTNGVDQSWKWAKPITGAGQATIEMIVKVSDPGSPVAYLMDNTGGTNRLSVWKSLSGSNWSATAGLTVSVDGGTAGSVFDKVTKIVITGDMTGLILGQLFAQYDDTAFAQVQPIYFSYKEDAIDGQSFSYTFDSGLGHELPVGAVLSRNHWEAGAVGGSWVDNGDGTYTCPNVGTISNLTGPTDLTNGTPYEVTVTVTSVDGSGATWINGGILIEGVNKQVIVPTIGSGIISTINTGLTVSKMEVREVSNALVAQNYDPTAWKAYVQQPDGTWKGKANKWDQGDVTEDGIAALYATLAEPADPLATDELYDVSLQANVTQGQLQLLVGFSGPIFQSVDESYQDERNTGANDFLRVRPTEIPAVGTLSNIKVHHKIKLSTAQQAAYYVEQVEKAIAGYKAKYPSGYVKKLDGVDDYVTHEAVSLAGKFKYGCTFSTNAVSNYQRLFASADGNVRAYLDISEGKLTIRLHDGTNPLYLTTNSLPIKAINGGVEHRLELVRHANNVFTATLDGQDLGSVTHAVPTPVVFDEALRSSTDTSFWEGQSRDHYIIDPTNPLPIGQGGNSGYWPLRDSGDIAEQVLGLDSKDNVVAGKGKGLGVELSSAVGVYNLVATGTWDTVSTPLAGNVLVENSWYFLEFDADIKSGSGISLFVKGTSQAVTASGRNTFLVQAGSGSTVNGIPFGATTADFDITNLTVKSAHGFGKWQGSPDSEYHTKDKATGALLGVEIVENGVFDDLSWWDTIDEPGDGTVSIVGSRLHVDADTASAFTGIRKSTHLTGGQSYRYSVEQEIIGSIGKLYAGLNVPLNDPGLNTGSFTALHSELSVGRNDLNTEVYLDNLSIKPEIPLSAELQRQYDLALVEAKIAKLDKAHAKFTALGVYDGVDDQTTMADMPFTGKFSVKYKISNALTSNADIIRLGRLLIQHRTDGIYVFPDVVASAVNTATRLLTLNDDLVHTIELVFTEGSADVDFIIDGGSTTTVTATASQAVNTATGLWTLGRGGYGWYNGYMGCVALLDYATPLNSRYYVHTLIGLIDKLASVGAEQAHSYELWTKPSGITIAADSLTFDGTQSDYAASVVRHKSGTDLILPAGNYLAKFTVSGATQGGVQTKVGNAPSGYKSNGDWEALLAADGVTVTLLQADASGFDGTVSDLSFTEQPNAGVYAGSPDAPLAVIKSGDDWYASSLWATGDVSYDGTEPDWTYKGGDSNLLTVGEEYAFTFTIDTISGGGGIDMIAGAVAASGAYQTETGTYSGTFVATHVACQMRKNASAVNAVISKISIKQVIKGA